MEWAKWKEKTTKQRAKKERIMFEYCPMIKAKCSFAAMRKEVLHCGLQTGNAEQTKVINMFKCPKDDIKKKSKRR